MAEIPKSAISGTLSAGTESFGNWQTYTGGRVTASSTTTRDPDGKYPRIVIGGKTLQPVTLGRDYDPVRDGPVEERLEELCGTQTVFTVGKPHRDGAGNIIRTKRRIGYVLEVMGGEGDTNDENGKPTLEVVIGLFG